MKFTNEKYPFVKLIEEGQYDRVANLLKPLYDFKMGDISHYEKQFFCSSFREEVKNNIEKIRELFPNITKFTGCELESPGFGYYFSVDPDIPDGLKVIVIKALNDSEVARVLENLSPLAMAEIINKDILQKTINALKDPVVVYAGKSVNFSKNLGQEEFVFDYWKIDDFKGEAFLENVIKKFYEWMFISIFKKYVKTDIQILGDESGHKKYFGGIKFFSDFPIRVFQYDRSYWREIIRNYPFPVREHKAIVWVGKGRTEKKEVTRRAHVRKGYHRHAKKDLRKQENIIAN